MAEMADNHHSLHNLHSLHSLHGGITSIHTGGTHSHGSIAVRSGGSGGVIEDDDGMMHMATVGTSLGFEVHTRQQSSDVGVIWVVRSSDRQSVLQSQGKPNKEDGEPTGETATCAEPPFSSRSAAAITRTKGDVAMGCKADDDERASSDTVPVYPHRSPCVHAYTCPVRDCDPAKSSRSMLGKRMHTCVWYRQSLCTPLA